MESTSEEQVGKVPAEMGAWSVRGREGDQVGGHQGRFAASEVSEETVCGRAVE